MKKHYVIYVTFFISGASALMYEIIWTRFFSLTFGSTTHSITAVLTAFMAGLAYGSLLLGKIADNIKRRLTFYGWIEVCIGLYALLFPYLFRLYSDFYLEIIGSGDASEFDKLALKFVMSLLLMLIPTILMGGSLPILGRVFIRKLKVVPRKLGILYSVNTMGAVAGIYLAGFHLIGKVGLNGSLLCAAALNICVGITMIIYARREGEQIDTALEVKPESSSYVRSRDETIIMVFAVAAFMCSGFVSLSYEVIWTRILTLIIGSSTYAFSIILICFLLGITLGSFLIGHEELIPRRWISITMFSYIQIGIGLSAFLLIPLFSILPETMLKAFEYFEGSYTFVTFYQFVLSLVIIIIPTTLMGASLPIVGKIVSTKVRSVGSSIGNIYFFNSFGAIFGAFLTGFVFIEHLGTLNTMKLGISINFILGILGVVISALLFKKVKPLIVSLSAAIIGITGVWTSQWDYNLMDTGVSIYGKTFIEESKAIGKSGTKMLYFHEGVNATITVRKGETSIHMKTNGKADASTSDGDMTTQTLLGYLPVLLNPDPRKVLVIGMGSGVTASTVAQFDSVRSLDIVEIEDSVMEAANYFNEVNYDVMNNPKAHIYINDGRNQLLEAKKKYDIIISEPSNPWISGIGSLYTTEYFKIVNARLNRGGVFCQWIHSYSMSIDNLKMILRTMATSFEDLQLWDSGSGDLLLIASNSEIETDFKYFDRVVNFSWRTKREFSKYLLVDYPVEILGRLMLDKSNILRFSEGARINSDKHPYLEFLAPKDLYLDERFMTLKLLSEWHEDNQPVLIEKIDKTDPRKAALIHYNHSKLYKEINWLDEAKHHLAKCLRIDDTNEKYHYLLGEVLLMEGNLEGAVKAIRKGFSINMTVEGVKIMAAVMFSRGQSDEALLLMERNKALFSDYELQYGEGLYITKHFGKALPYLMAALEKKPDNEYLLLEKIARSFQAVGNMAKAEEYFIRSINKQEMNPWARIALADMYVDQARYREAEKHYTFILKYWDDERLNTDKIKRIVQEVLPGLVKG